MACDHAERAGNTADRHQPDAFRCAGDELLPVRRFRTDGKHKGTVFAGIALLLSPLLFRPLLGSTRTFLLSLLLAFSPVLLASARSGSPDVWALLFAMISLWGLWQATRYYRYAAVAVIGLAALAFLSSSGGLILAVILGVALGLTAVWRRGTTLTDDDELAEAMLEALRGTLRLALPGGGVGRAAGQHGGDVVPGRVERGWRSRRRRGACAGAADWKRRVRGARRALL